MVNTPRLYAVVLHNDDYTPMDFVVEILAKIFRKGPAEAEEVMLLVHNEGSGVAGVYPFDIAVTKKAQAERSAGEKGYPLKLTLAEES